jgi:hypothetical protein
VEDFDRWANRACQKFWPRNSVLGFNAIASLSVTAAEVLSRL